jgi:hypothetical protein
MMTDAAIDQTFQDSIKTACEHFYAAYPEELADEERITKFVSVLTFELEKSPEEIVKATMEKNLHTLLYDDIQLNKMKKTWGALIGSKVEEQNKNSFTFGINDASPETKKSQINLQILTQKSSQIALLEKNLQALEHNPEFPIIALKIYTSKAEEVKAFAEQMMEMFGAEAIFSTLPVQPEIRFVTAEDHLIIEVCAKKSLELTFMTMLIRGFLGKLPEHDCEIDLSVLLGSNFGDLINNHSDNTVRDVMDGFKINVEFKNNLKGFMEEACNFFFSKAQKNTDSKRKHIYTSWGLKGIGMALGSFSMNGGIKLNFSPADFTFLYLERLMQCEIPRVNIFDKEGILSKTPIGQAKMMMDSNEMFAPIMELMNTMEGKGELYFMSPLFGASGEIDVSGIMDLAMHVINIYSE